MWQLPDSEPTMETLLWDTFPLADGTDLLGTFPVVPGSKAWTLFPALGPATCYAESHAATHGAGSNAAQGIDTPHVALGYIEADWQAAVANPGNYIGVLLNQNFGQTGIMQCQLNGDGTGGLTAHDDSANPLSTPLAWTPDLLPHKLRLSWDGRFLTASQDGITLATLDTITIGPFTRRGSGFYMYPAAGLRSVFCTQILLVGEPS